MRQNVRIYKLYWDIIIPLKGYFIILNTIIHLFGTNPGVIIIKTVYIIHKSVFNYVSYHNK